MGTNTLWEPTVPDEEERKRLARLGMLQMRSPPGDVVPLPLGGTDMPPAPPPPEEDQEAAVQALLAQAKPPAAQKSSLRSYDKVTEEDAPGIDAGAKGPSRWVSLAAMLPNLLGQTALALDSKGKGGMSPDRAATMDQMTANMRASLAQDQSARDAYTNRLANLKNMAAQRKRSSSRYAEETNYNRSQAAGDRAAAAGQRSISNARADASLKAQQEANDPSSAINKWRAAQAAEGKAADRANKLADAEQAHQNNLARDAAKRGPRGGGGGGGGGVGGGNGDKVRAMYEAAGQPVNESLVARAEATSSKQLNSVLDDASTDIAKLAAGPGSEEKALQAKTQSKYEDARADRAALGNLIATGEKLLKEGQEYVPGSEPTISAQNLVTTPLAKTFGSSTKGTTGFTPAQAEYKSGLELKAGGMYNAVVHNSPNLLPEMERAMAAFKSNNSMAGSVAALKEMVRIYDRSIEELANSQMASRKKEIHTREGSASTRSPSEASAADPNAGKVHINRPGKGPGWVSRANMKPGDTEIP